MNEEDNSDGRDSSISSGNHSDSDSEILDEEEGINSDTSEELLAMDDMYGDYD